MNILKLLLSTTIALLLLVPLAASAHHSHANLDRTKPVTLTGVVSKFSWRVPHVSLLIDVPQKDGKVVQYVVASNNPPSMTRVGWTADTFKPGDKIIWHGFHDRDPNRLYTGLDWAQKSNGRRMFASVQGLKTYYKEKGQELPKNISAVMPVVAAKTFPSGGYWKRIGPDGGRFKPNRFPPNDWPLTEKSALLVANFHETQNPLNECIWAGPPRMMLVPMAYHFRWEGKDKIILDRDLWPEPRVIYMDSSTPAPERSRWGHSVGRFEGKILVVETTNFLADRWGTRIGIDSSDQKYLIERYWMSEDGMRLNLEFTVTDPVNLTEPVTMTHQWGKVADSPLLRIECSVEAAWFYITAGYEEDQYEVEVPDILKKK